MNRTVARKMFQQVCSATVAIWLLVSSAYAEIAIIIHPENPLDSLTKHEIKKIFLGQSRLFPKTSQGMRVIDLKGTDQVYRQFYEEFIGFPIHKLQRYRAAYLFSGKGTLPEEFPDSASVKKHVSESQDAIGYIDASLIDESVRVIHVWTDSNSLIQEYNLLGDIRL